MVKLQMNIVRSFLPHSFLITILGNGFYSRWFEYGIRFFLYLIAFIH